MNGQMLRGISLETWVPLHKWLQRQRGIEEFLGQSSIHCVPVIWCTQNRLTLINWQILSHWYYFLWKPKSVLESLEVVPFLMMEGLVAPWAHFRGKRSCSELLRIFTGMTRSTLNHKGMLWGECTSTISKICGYSFPLTSDFFQIPNIPVSEFVHHSSIWPRLNGRLFVFWEWRLFSIRRNEAVERLCTSADILRMCSLGN